MMAPFGSCGDGMRKAHGFSLLEMMIAMAVLGVGLAIAASLFFESQRVLVQTANEARDSVFRNTVAQLRADIQGASGTARSGGLWSRDQLELLVRGERIRWRRSGDTLVRLKVDGFGTEIGRRIMLKEVEQWEWNRSELARVVDLRIAYRRRVASSWEIASTRWRDRQAWLDRREMRFALRGAGRSTGW